jgi:hypothetical protein
MALMGPPLALPPCPSAPPPRVAGPAAPLSRRCGVPPSRPCARLCRRPRGVLPLSRENGGEGERKTGGGGTKLGHARRKRDPGEAGAEGEDRGAIEGADGAFGMEGAAPASRTPQQ